MISYTAGRESGVVRLFKFPFGWCFHPASGIWWIGAGRCRASLKSPRCRPLFSERNGQFKHCQIGGGWRFRLWKIAPEAKDSVGLNRQPRGQP